MAASGDDIVVMSTIGAPRERVFRAWIDRASFVRWWGPHGFTTPFCEIDARPGGSFRYRLRSPDGRDYWCEGVYREIAAPERIVFADHFTDEAGEVVPASRYRLGPGWPAETLVTVTFEEPEPGRTTLTLRHAGIPEADRGDCATGWGESLEKLAAIAA